MQHEIAREIGIDMGHRVTFHGSKCRNAHGHRYRIIAHCVGPLFPEGEQQGMVLDFGFLKEEMMREIDEPCDHGTTFWIEDMVMRRMFQPEDDAVGLPADFWEYVAAEIERNVYYSGVGVDHMKIYVVAFVPTAENLARHWFERLAPRVQARSNGLARLLRMEVWETPNCSASYSPPPPQPIEQMRIGQ